MHIEEISKQINANAHDKGFWDEGIDKPKKLLLAVSELCEAMEADREDRYFNPERPNNKWAFDIVNSNNEAWVNWFILEVKHTFQDELADAVIRIFDLAFEMGIDLSYHIENKHRYNCTREKMHNKKY